MQVGEMMDLFDFAAMYSQANEDSAKAAELKEATDAFLAVVEEQKALLLKLHKAEERVNEAKIAWGIPVGDTKVSKKPNVEIYTEIIRAHGKPMHVKQIAAALKDYGNVLKGKNEPEIQVRNALNASKRFENVGDNTWWVVSDPLPGCGSPPTDPRTQFSLGTQLEEAA